MKYFLIILLITGGFLAHGQTRPTGVPTQFSTGWFRQGWHQADSGSIFSLRSDTGLFVPTFPFTVIGRRTASDTSLYLWTGGRWKPIGSGSSGGSVTSIAQGYGVVLTPNPIVSTGTIAADTSSANSLVTQYDLANNAYVVGRNLRIISGSPNKDTLATIDTLISVTVGLSDSTTRVATTEWVKKQAYGTGSGGSAAAGSTGDMQYKGSTGLLSTSPGSFFNIDSTNKKLNIGNPGTATGTLNVDSGDINVIKAKYLINGISVLEQNSAANQLDVAAAAAITSTRLFSGGSARLTVTNTLITSSVATFAINSKLTSGGVSVIDWSGTILSMGSNDAGFNTLALKVAAAEKARLTSGGTFQINTTSSATGIEKRRLFVNGSVGINKDSVPIITSITSQYVLVQDTATGADSGQIKRVLAAVVKAPAYNAQSGTTYTVLASDASTIIGLTNTAARTITLAAANAYPAGTVIWFKDQAGTGATGNITINRAGSDTIDGATSYVISSNYGFIGLYTNGSNAWFVQ